MILLAIIALIVIPPEKLPDAARQLARFINDLKRNTSGIWDDIKKDAMAKPSDFVKPEAPKPEVSEEEAAKIYSQHIADESEKKPHE